MQGMPSFSLAAALPHGGRTAARRPGFTAARLAVRLRCSPARLRGCVAARGRTAARLSGHCVWPVARYPAGCQLFLQLRGLLVEQRAAMAIAAGAAGGAPPAHPLPPPAAAKWPHPPDGGGDPALHAPPHGAQSHDAALEVLQDGSAAARWRGALISPGCAGRAPLPTLETRETAARRECVRRKRRRAGRECAARANAAEEIAAKTRPV
jgi:hypothetical protein